MPASRRAPHGNNIMQWCVHSVFVCVCVLTILPRSCGYWTRIGVCALETLTRAHFSPRLLAAKKQRPEERIVGRRTRRNGAANGNESSHDSFKRVNYYSYYFFFYGKHRKVTRTRLIRVVDWRFNKQRFMILSARVSADGVSCSKRAQRKHARYCTHEGNKVGLALQILYCPSKKWIKSKSD